MWCGFAIRMDSQAKRIRAIRHPFALPDQRVHQDSRELLGEHLVSFNLHTTSKPVVRSYSNPTHPVCKINLGKRWILAGESWMGPVAGRFVSGSDDVAPKNTISHKEPNFMCNIFMLFAVFLFQFSVRRKRLRILPSI